MNPKFVLIALVAAPVLFGGTAEARVPSKCGPLFAKAGKNNDLMVNRFDQTRAMIDGELAYVKRRRLPGSRIRLGKLSDEFGRRYGDATAMLQSVEKAFRCAAPATTKCRPLYIQVTADKLRVERRLKATSNYLLSFPASYGDTLATRREIVRFAEHFTLIMEAQLNHQQSALAAVRCASPKR